MIDATPERVARHVGDRARSHGERRARSHAMVRIWVLGVRVGAVPLNLGAVAWTVEGDGCRIDGRLVATAAAYQGDHDKRGSHRANGQGCRRLLQLSFAMIFREEIGRR